jgi:hypothetical protein
VWDFPILLQGVSLHPITFSIFPHPAVEKPRTWKR